MVFRAGAGGFAVSLRTKSQGASVFAKKGWAGRLVGFARGAKEDVSWLVPCALAMGLCQALMYIPFLLGPAGKGLGSLLWWDPSITTVFFVAVALTMAADGIAAKKGISGVSRVCNLAVPQVGTFVAGQLLLVMQGLASEEALQLVVGCSGAVLCGFATACAQLSSARFLARLKPEKSFEVVLAAQPVTAAVVLYALLCPGIWFGLPLAVLPILARACVARTENRLPFDALLTAVRAPEQLGMTGSQANLRAGVVTGCTVILSALAIFVGRSWLEAASLAGAGVVSPVDLGCCLAVFCVVLLATSLLCFANKTIFMTQAFRVAIPPASLAAVLAAFACGESTDGLMMSLVVILLSVFSLALLDQMVWVLTAGFMRANETSSETVVATMRSFEFAGAAFGAGLVKPLVYAWGTVPTLFVAVAVLLGAFVICVPTFEPHLVSPGKETPEGLKVLAGEEAGHYAMFVSRFGLTAREAEVLALLADGADAAAVASQLVVSLSTANTHIRHIYAKLGIHSRQELMARLALVGE